MRRSNVMTLISLSFETYTCISGCDNLKTIFRHFKSTRQLPEYLSGNDRENTRKLFRINHTYVDRFFCRFNRYTTNGFNRKRTTFVY